MNGADLLMAALENEGVKQIFGVPGEENLDVVEALHRSTMTPLTKMAQQIVSPAAISAIVREASRIAQQERPGPVHLELPNGDTHALAGHRFCSVSPVPCGVR